MKKNKNSKLILCLILIFALFLSIGITYGPSTTEGSDDFIYTDAGYLILNNKFKELTGILYNRYIIGAGNAFFYLLFGYSPFSASLFGVLCFLATIVVVYEIAKILFSEDVGLIAAFLFSIFPGIVFQSSNVGDAVPMTLFASSSVLFALKAVKRKVRLKYLLLSGYFSVVGFLTSGEEILIIPVLFFIVFYYFKKLKKEFVNGILSLFFGIILGIATLCLLSYLHSSDFFEWYKINAEFYTKGYEKNQPAFFWYLKTLFPNQLFYSNFKENYFGFYGYFTIFSLLVTFLKKKKVWIPLFWFSFILLYLGFGTASLTKYVFLSFLERYLFICVPPMVMIISLGILETFETLKKRSKFALLLFIVLTLAFVVHSIFLSVYLLYSKNSSNYLLFEVGKFLLKANTNNSKVYFEWSLLIQIFTNYKFNFQGFSLPQECSSFQKNSFIVTFKNQTLQNNCNLSRVFEISVPENLKTFDVFGTKIPTADGDTFWGLDYKNVVVAVYKN